MTGSRFCGQALQANAWYIPGFCLPHAWHSVCHVCHVAWHTQIVAHHTVDGPLAATVPRATIIITSQDDLPQITCVHHAIIGRLHCMAVNCICEWLQHGITHTQDQVKHQRTKEDMRQAFGEYARHLVSTR